MKFSISSCSFYKYKIRRLLEIPEDCGVELFADFGSKDYTDRFMEELRRNGNRGSFSMHAPFSFIDLANTDDEERDFESLRHHFDTYHKNNAEFYVLHPYRVLLSSDESYLSEARKRSVDRIARVHTICREDGVNVVLENICEGGTSLFDQEQFLRIFEDIPTLNCLIDVGHALVTGYDISEMQRKLGGRINAYHLHNNNGLQDQHLRVLDGVYKWDDFCVGVKKYTPLATGVMEYMSESNVKNIVEDIEYLKKRING